MKNIVKKIYEDWVQEYKDVIKSSKKENLERSLLILMDRNSKNKNFFISKKLVKKGLYELFLQMFVYFYVFYIKYQRKDEKNIFREIKIKTNKLIETMENGYIYADVLLNEEFSGKITEYKNIEEATDYLYERFKDNIYNSYIFGSDNIESCIITTIQSKEKKIETNYLLKFFKNDYENIFNNQEVDFINYILGSNYDIKVYPIIENYIEKNINSESFKQFKSSKNKLIEYINNNKTNTYIWSNEWFLRFQNKILDENKQIVVDNDYFTLLNLFKNDGDKENSYKLLNSTFGFIKDTKKIVNLKSDEYYDIVGFCVTNNLNGVRNNIDIDNFENCTLDFLLENIKENFSNMIFLSKTSNFNLNRLCKLINDLINRIVVKRSLHDNMNFSEVTNKIIKIEKINKLQLDKSLWFRIFSNRKYKKPEEKENITGIINYKKEAVLSVEKNQKNIHINKSQTKAFVTEKNNKIRCQHWLTWGYIHQTKIAYERIKERKNITRADELKMEQVYYKKVNDFVKKYAEQSNGQYICRSCGETLNQKKFFGEGYNYEGMFIPEFTSMIDDYEIIKKYDDFLKYLEKILAMISHNDILSINNFKVYESDQNIRLCKETFRIISIIQDNKLLDGGREIYENSICQNVTFDFTRLTNESNEIHISTIYCYLISIIIVNLTFTSILNFKQTKLINKDIFKEVKDKLFKNLKIKINGEDKNLQSEEFNVLCYVIYYFSSVLMLTKTWLNDDISHNLNEFRGRKSTKKTSWDWGEQRRIIESILHILNIITSFKIDSKLTENTRDFIKNIKVKLNIKLQKFSNFKLDIRPWEEKW